MKFKIRMRRTFAGLAILSGICIGIIYSIITAKAYIAEMYSLTSQTAEWTENKFEDIVNQTKSSYMMMLSDSQTLRALQCLAKDSEDRSIYENKYFSDSYSIIRENIDIFFVYEPYYRILFYNEKGDVITGTNTHDRVIDGSLTLYNFTDRVQMKQGELKILGCQKDSWGRSNNNTQVLSIIKRLIGNNMGFVEIQWTKKNLDNALIPIEPSSEIMLYDTEGNLLYTNEKKEIDYYSLIDFQANQGTYFLMKENRVVSYKCNNELGIITVVAENTNLFEKIFVKVFPPLMIVLLIFTLGAILYINISSEQLIKPIVELCRIMENTELDNMENETDVESSLIEENEEIAAMFTSFQNMLERLSISMEQEKKLSILQLQAQFDLLQAQVNPHFLYNVLNIISAKGMLANDESICDACSCLGKMLRYSTSTIKKTGTLYEERQYLDLYFRLLRYRYEQRLEYKIDIDQSIEEVLLPKITIQQIVENSINHGYSKIANIIQIYITGTETADGWKVNVHDNGIGFKQEKIDELNISMEKLKKRLSISRDNIEMQIGGMGLINTFGRLYLVYGDMISLEISSGENGTDVGIVFKQMEVT